jgi:hypothetical protein
MRAPQLSLVLAVSLVAALQACGSDEDDGSGATAASTSSSGAVASSSSSSGAASSSASTGEGGSAGEPAVGGGGGAGGASVCPSTHTCAEEAPVNWTGPVALSLSDTQPACFGGYPVSLGEYVTDLDPGAASCSCSCEPASGIQCANGVDLCYAPATKCFASACMLGPNITLAPDVCTSLPTNDTGKVVATVKAPTNVGSCAATPNFTLPTPAWGTQAKACDGAAIVPEVCESGEVCTPTGVAPFDKICITRVGEVACPSQFYSEQHVVYESFTDTRSCSACSCGSASSSCGGKVNLSYSLNTPCSVPVNEVTPGTCGEFGALATNGTYVPAPTGMCPASASTLTGEVTPTSPVTFCCHP